MPPTTSHQGRHTRRRVIWIVAIVVLALGGLLFVRLGALMIKEDPLQSADAILVLAGTVMERPLEAMDLYREGRAPIIVMTQERPEEAVRAVDARGVHVPDRAESAREVLLKLGVPDEAMIIPPERHDNTAHEAHTFRLLAREHGWRRVIVVTSKYHTRRAGFAVRREFEGSGVQVIVRGSRYDPADPPRWWRHRRDIQYVPTEVQKLIAYVLGLGM